MFNKIVLPFPPSTRENRTLIAGKIATSSTEPPRGSTRPGSTSCTPLRSDGDTITAVSLRGRISNKPLSVKAIFYFCQKCQNSFEILMLQGSKVCQLPCLPTLG